MLFFLIAGNLLNDCLRKITRHHVGKSSTRNTLNLPLEQAGHKSIHLAPRKCKSRSATEIHLKFMN